MTWRSFMDFWIMREMGQEDAIIRNYDVGREFSKDSSLVYVALKRAGLRPERRSDAESYLPSLAQRIANVYGIPAPSIALVRARLAMWYYWDRIRLGELVRWYRRKEREQQE